VPQAVPQDWRESHHRYFAPVAREWARPGGPRFPDESDPSLTSGGYSGRVMQGRGRQRWPLQYSLSERISWNPGFLSLSGTAPVVVLTEGAQGDGYEWVRPIGGNFPPSPCGGGDALPRRLISITGRRPSTAPRSPVAPHHSRSSSRLAGLHRSAVELGWPCASRAVPAVTGRRQERKRRGCRFSKERDLRLRFGVLDPYDSINRGEWAR
jgi:hypothetical protein